MSTLLFFGDSITDAGRFTDPEALGDGYVRMIAQSPAGAGPRRVVNRGTSGDRIGDLLRRWDADVRAFVPDVLTVFVGINDTWRRFDSDDPTPAHEFEEGYRRLLSAAAQLEWLRALVLVEPFVVPVEPAQEEWLDDLAGKREVVARLAREVGAGFIPLHGILTTAARERGAGAIAADGVHPTPAGHRLIAEAWLESMNEPGDNLSDTLAASPTADDSAKRYR